MNTPRTHRSSRSRRSRKLAAAFGSLGLATTLAFSGLVGEGVTETEAAWTDTEAATAEVKAAWPEAFASTTSGSARSADSMINTSDNMTYNSDYRWTIQLTEDAQVTEVGRFRHERYLGPSVENNLPPTGPYFNFPEDSLGNALHNGKSAQSFSGTGASFPTRTTPRASNCLTIAPGFSNAEGSLDCNLGNSYAAAENYTDSFGFSIGTGSRLQAGLYTYLNSAFLRTGVRCSLTGATAERPQGRIDFGQEYSWTLGDGPFLRYAGNGARTIWSSGKRPDGEALGEVGGYSNFPPSENTISEEWTVQSTVTNGDTVARVMPVITQKTGFNGQPYAISEVAAYIEIYRGALLSTEALHAKMYFVLSRSECGVKRTGDASLPEQASTFPTNGIPGDNDGNNKRVAFTGTTYAPDYWGGQRTNFVGRINVRNSQPADATSTLPPTTTVTSPTEHTTASETTTSAPPNPDDADEATSNTSTTRTSTTQTSTSASVTGTSTSTSTTTKVPATTATTSSTTAPTTVSTPPAGPTATSTSAAPEIVIPDEPGQLSPAARLEDAGIAEVGGEELVVVVTGDTIPLDARQGVTALETWLGGGNPGSTWETFASDDPDSDGWRWAAINQETGTLVYIR